MEIPELETRVESPAAHVLVLTLVLAIGLLYASDGDPYTAGGLAVLAIVVLVDLFVGWRRGGRTRRVARSDWTDWDELDD
ncbi:MAG: hypothetical protein ABEJ22_04365 [Haloferacaceae archaeon]